MLRNIKIIMDVIKEGMEGVKMSFFSTRRDRYGYIAQSSKVRSPVWGPKNNIYIYENCGVNAFAKFICQHGKFVLKKNCSVGPGLTVITFNHKYDQVGQIPESNGWRNLEPSEVIVNEDVWIGANVTLCPGAFIGRGSIIAAGSICIRSKKYPPYSIIGGNPATFIKFRLSLDQQIEQEKLRYTEEERIPVQELKNNYLNFKK